MYTLVYKREIALDKAEIDGNGDGIHGQWVFFVNYVDTSFLILLPLPSKRKMVKLLSVNR